jgi:carboxyl-terminal processing protease
MKLASSHVRHFTRWHCITDFARALLPQILIILALAGMTAGCGTTGKSLAEGPAAALETAPEPILNEEQQQANAETFDKVWQAVNETFWDPEFGGTDWAAVRETFTPQVATATTQSEARHLMRQALEELGESHFYIIPAELYEDMSSGPKGQGDCGLRVRVIDGHAIVVKVLPDSPGEGAGIQCGWELLTAGDSELRPFVETLEAEYAGSRTLSSKLSIAARGKLRGEIGDELPLRFLDGEGKERVLSLPLAEPQGHKTVFSNLPPAWVNIRAERLADDIGYISLDVFMDPTFTMGEFNKAMTSFRDCRGVMLDLRGNGGGIAGMAPGLAGWFVAEKNQSLGEMMTRDSHVNLLVRPKLNGFRGPLAVLVDGLSASTAEFLAAGLQDLGRARVFGSRSAGAALVANMIRLPNGDGFEYAFADYESAGGGRIEGIGITPDVEIPYSRASLLKDEDMALAAAIAWINQSQ